MESRQTAAEALNKETRADFSRRSRRAMARRMWGAVDGWRFDIGGKGVIFKRNFRLSELLPLAVKVEIRTVQLVGLAHGRPVKK